MSHRDENNRGWKTSIGLWRRLKPEALRMRKTSTHAEDIVWQVLRNRQVRNLKFRRQHCIDRFIVDFYCAELKVIIEIDGPIHQQMKEQHSLRQEYLEQRGYRVLRFTNDEVIQDTGCVIRKIEAIMDKNLK